jgi:hypothetical protein
LGAEDERVAGERGGIHVEEGAESGEGGGEGMAHGEAVGFAEGVPGELPGTAGGGDGGIGGGEEELAPAFGAGGVPAGGFRGYEGVGDAVEGERGGIEVGRGGAAAAKTRVSTSRRTAARKSRTRQ